VGAYGGSRVDRRPLHEGLLHGGPHQAARRPPGPVAGARSAVQPAAAAVSGEPAARKSPPESRPISGSPGRPCPDDAQQFLADLDRQAGHRQIIDAIGIVVVSCDSWRATSTAAWQCTVVLGGDFDLPGDGWILPGALDRLPQRSAVEDFSASRSA